MYGLASEDKKEELSELITMLTDEHPLSKDGYNREIFGSLSLNDYLLFKQAYKSGGAKVNRNGLYAFNCMDRAVQHLKKCGVAIALSSTRIYKYEAINTENATCWYHGDGMIFIYTDGYDYSWEYYWYANPYKMPGTTVNLAERNAVVLSPSMYGGSPYAGGVQQGKYGAVGYINCYPESIGNGTFASYNGSKISTNKSYFLFDNEIVCLGSGIKDYTGKEVITTVENRLWRDSDVLSIGGTAVDEPAKIETTVTERTMHFTNMGGYVFLGNTVGKVSYRKAKNGPVTNFGPSSINQGDYYTTYRSFLEITISHGKSNMNLGTVGYDKYSYLYLPEASAEETEIYANNPDVEILKLTDNIHAAYENTLGIIAVNFFEEYPPSLKVNKSDFAVKNIETESPASIMISKGENGEYIISISDPTQTYRQNNLHIKIDGVSQIVSSDARLEAEIDDGLISIVANTNGAAGATLTLIVK
jgi:hyaluronate lyase